MDYRQSTRPFQAITYNVTVVGKKSRESIENRTEVRTFLHKGAGYTGRETEEMIREIELGEALQFDVSPKKSVIIERTYD